MEVQTDYSFYDRPRYKLTLSISTSLFFMLFLLVFQPFGVNNYSTKRVFTLEFIGILAVVMLVTFTIMIINEFFLRKWVVKKLSLGVIIVWSIWTCFLLGLGNFLFYNWLGDWHDFSISSATEFVFNITKVSIFLMVGAFFYFRNIDLDMAF